MKYYEIINFDIADSQLMLCKDVCDMQVIFKTNSTWHIIPFLLKIYFLEGSLSKRAPGIPMCWWSHLCAVHPTLYLCWALWPRAYGKKRWSVTLTLDYKGLWLPFCPLVLLYFILFYYFSLCFGESCHDVSSPMERPLMARKGNLPPTASKELRPAIAL